MEDMSRPKRPPPMQAKEPTTYCKTRSFSLLVDDAGALTGLEAIAALYYIALSM